MADYLLWGKDPTTGLNGKQSGLDLHSKHKTWDSSSIDSLEQLMEQPTFSEASLTSLQSTQFRAKREVFSREEALASASPSVRESFLNLFSDIDRLDFMCETYDLLHGKRQKPIRAELLKKFSEEEQCTMRERVVHWNQYHYLKQRHELVELRREQYTLRDSYRTTILSQSDEFILPNHYEFDADIPVLPLGIKHDEPLSALIFRAWRDLDPATIHERDLASISDLYWKKKQFAPGTCQSWFDFRELEHVYQLLNF